MDQRERRARDFVRRAFAGAMQSTSREGGRRRFRSHIATKSIEEVLAGAWDGDKEAIAVLQERGRGFRSSGVAPPKEFHLFVWSYFLDGPPKGRPGPKPYEYSTRDDIIAAMVRILHEEFGFPPTRGAASKANDNTVSCCQLVAEEAPRSLMLTEDTVEAIWKASLSKVRMEAQQP